MKSRRKKSKSNVDLKYAVQPNQLNTSMSVVKGVKAQKFDAGEELVSTNNVGRDSYVVIAKKQGLYYLIKASIREFKSKNKDTGFKDLYEYLQPLFPSVFTDVNMHPGNFKKKIEQDIGWTNAYYCSQVELTTLAKDRLYEVLSRETVEDKVIISAYDKVMKYSLAEKELIKQGHDKYSMIEFGFQPNDDESVGDE